MKILLISPQWIGGWLEGVELAIHYLGHTFISFLYDAPLAPSVAGNRNRVLSYSPSYLHPLLMPFAVSVGRAWMDRMNKRLIKLIQSLKPELVLILKSETLRAETLAALQSPDRQIVS